MNIIQANELKKGNFVLDRGGKTIRVDWIEKYKVCMDLSNDSQFPLQPLTEDFEYLQPIPLTEDILLKCGFEKYSTDKSINYKLGAFRFNYVNEGKFKGKRYLTYGNVLSSTSHRAMEYLHSFQNLYFALTQQELEIKL